MFSFRKTRCVPNLLLTVSLVWTTLLWLSGPISVWADTQNTIPSPETLRGCGGAHFSSSDEAFEQEVLRLVNQIRLDNGLLPMKRVAGLTSAARFHAIDMSEENYFSHTSHDRINGELVESCSWSDRLNRYYTDWNSASENIAAGFSTPQAVVNGWMNSPGHKQNILSSTNWETGIGYFKGNGSYTRYWVQDFGRRSGVYPVVINGENETTADGNLTLHLYGSWENVRLRVDQNDWSDWQSFAPAMVLQLKAAQGTHTVEVEMRSATESATASDTIYLSQNTAEPALNNLPDALTFFYDPAKGTLSPGFHTIQPLAAQGDPSFGWQVLADQAWLGISPGQGNGSETVTLVPSLAGAGQTSSDEALVTISLRRGDGSLVEEKIIAVLLMVEPKYRLFAPVVQGK